MNPDNSAQTAANARQPISLPVTSPALTDGRPIPKEFTGEGEDKSPPLAWSGPPENIKEYALIAHDPDAPAGVWNHWVLYNIPASTTSLPAALKRAAVLQSPIEARQGINSWPDDNVGYRGPMPPRGHGAHRYFFTVYALDTHIELAPNLATAEALQHKMSGHVVAQGQLMGTYERK